MREPTYQEQDDGDGSDEDEGRRGVAREQARFACLAAQSEEGHSPAAVWTFHLLRILCLYSDFQLSATTGQSRLLKLGGFPGSATTRPA
jgi:hypothetical protein